MSSINNLFGIHVIGAGFGESIVLEFPDHSAAVIDPFCADTTLSEANRAKLHPIIRFLERKLKPHRIRFVLLTHPHADHCLGFSQFIRHFTPIIDRLWLPAIWELLFARQYLVALQSTRKRDVTEESVLAKPGTILAEMDGIDTWIDRHQGKVDYFKSDMRLTIDREDQQIEVRCYAPDAQAIRRLSRFYARVFRVAQVDPGNCTVVLMPRNLPCDGKWNRVSCVILLRWREAEFLFAGDAEKPTWDRVFRRLTDQGTPLEPSWRVAWVKIPHHGSHTGYNDELYRSLNKDAPPIGVLTPFNRAGIGNRLPSAQGVAGFGPRLANTYTTCMRESLQAANWQSTGSLAEGYAGVNPEDLTDQVVTYLRDRPRIAQSLFEPTEDDGNARLVEQAIPQQMLDDLEVVPELRCLFPVGLQHTLAAAIDPENLGPETVFRVSHYFSASGQLDRSEYGDGAGRLVGVA